MSRFALRWLGAFLIGSIGWLVALGLAAEFGWLAAVLLGALAAVTVGRADALPTLWLGILAAYPLALAFGRIESLGDGLEIALALLALLTSAGFVVGVLALRLIRASKS